MLSFRSIAEAKISWPIVTQIDVALPALVFHCHLRDPHSSKDMYDDFARLPPINLSHHEIDVGTTS